MTAYYNEIDPYAAAWLRNLIVAGHLPAGDIDTRSIVEVQPDDIKGYDECHFFAGIGGWPLALRMAGWTGRPVWTGSCPCQPFSAAGKRAGTDDERHLWPEFFRLIAACRPAAVFGEQVSGSGGVAWFAAVRNDLEAAGYSVGGADIPACSVGAPHLRRRLFWVADLGGERASGPLAPVNFGTAGQGWPSSPEDMRAIRERPFSRWGCMPEPLVRCLDDGVSPRVDGLHSFGNAIVPQVAAEFVSAFIECRP